MVFQCLFFPSVLTSAPQFISLLVHILGSSQKYGAQIYILVNFAFVEHRYKLFGWLNNWPTIVLNATLAGRISEQFKMLNAISICK